jgi:ribosomal protein S18 acetylase RimI-like enzyme
MFTVTRADKAVTDDVRLQMSEIFAEGFTQWLIFFSKDKNKIAKAFAHMFVLDQFYVAINGNKVAAMAACTDCATLSVKLDKKELRKYLGFYKGSLAGIFLKKEFENPFENPPSDTGSIEFVGTHPDFRGQGAASQVIRHIISNTPYQEYMIAEVADTNTPAMKLYEKMGFIEYKRTPVPFMRAKKIGINNFIALKYEK